MRCIFLEGGVDVLRHNVKQQHHHLFTGLRSSSRGSGLQRNDSVWKVVNRSSRPSRPSSTCPAWAAWRVWSWGCLTGTRCHYIFYHTMSNCCCLCFYSSCTHLNRPLQFVMELLTAAVKEIRLWNCSNWWPKLLTWQKSNQSSVTHIVDR